jgi:hypothetical protein
VDGRISKNLYQDIPADPVFFGRILRNPAESFRRKISAAELDFLRGFGENSAPASRSLPAQQSWFGARAKTSLLKRILNTHKYI